MTRNAPPQPVYRVECSHGDWTVATNELETGVWALDRLYAAHLAACHPEPEQHR